MRSAFVFAAIVVSTAAYAGPVTYEIDSSHSFPRFEYRHLGFSTQQSRFNKTTGSIVLDKEARIGQATIIVDARSIDTGVPALNRHIQTEEFFDTQHFPEIVFISDDFRFDGERPVAINGVLTVKGITRPLVLNIVSFKCMLHPMAKKEACGADAVGTLKRSEFNMGKYVPLVSDEVTLRIAVEAMRK